MISSALPLSCLTTPIEHRLLCAELPAISHLGIGQLLCLEKDNIKQVNINLGLSGISGDGNNINREMTSFMVHGPNFIELLKQKLVLVTLLLSRKEHDTSHKLYMYHGSLTGNLILVSINLLCLAVFSV